MQICSKLSFLVTKYMHNNLLLVTGHLMMRWHLFRRMNANFPQQLAANSLTRLNFQMGRNDAPSEVGSTATQIPGTNIFVPRKYYLLAALFCWLVCESCLFFLYIRAGALEMLYYRSQAGIKTRKGRAAISDSLKERPPHHYTSGHRWQFLLCHSV